MLVSILQHRLMHKVTLDTAVAALWLQRHKSYFPVCFRSSSRGYRFVPSSRFAKQLMTETNDNSPNSLNCSAVSDGVPDIHGSVVSKDDSSRGKELLSAVGLMRGFSWKRRAGECHLADLFFPPPGWTLSDRNRLSTQGAGSSGRLRRHRSVQKSD